MLKCSFMPFIVLRASQQTVTAQKQPALKMNKTGKYQAQVLNGKMLPEYTVLKSIYEKHINESHMIY